MFSVNDLAPLAVVLVERARPSRRCIKHFPTLSSACLPVALSLYNSTEHNFVVVGFGSFCYLTANSQTAKCAVTFLLRLNFHFPARPKFAMIRYFNPGGHNWGSENLDGYGISQIAFIVTYTICLYTACAYLWFFRHHPVIKMRKIGLAIVSILILHVYLFMVFMVYPLNGAFPCSVEFWLMSIYLPLGIGLFQVQNQQLLIVSREQDQLLRNEHFYKPLYPRAGFKLCGPKYWIWRLKLWWQGIATQSKYEWFVVVGMTVQVSDCNLSSRGS